MSKQSKATKEEHNKINLKGIITTMIAQLTEEIIVTRHDSLRYERNVILITT